MRNLVATIPATRGNSKIEVFVDGGLIDIIQDDEIVEFDRGDLPALIDELRAIPRILPGDVIAVMLVGKRHAADLSECGGTDDGGIAVGGMTACGLDAEPAIPIDGDDEWPPKGEPDVCIDCLKATKAMAMA